LAHSLYDMEPLLPLVGQGYTLVTPNIRLARRIRAEWSRRRMAAGDGAWEPFPVLALDHWLQDALQGASREGLLELRPQLAQDQELELWRRVIEEHAAHSGSYPLLRETAAAELASAARDTLLRWQVRVTDRALRQRFELDRDCATFLAWLELFEQQLRSRRLWARADALVALSRSGYRQPGSGVVLLEFDDIAPLHRTLLDTLCVEVLEPEGTTTEPDCRLLAFSDPREELQGMAAWAAQLHREEPESTIGIVIGDDPGQRVALEYLMRREFGCLGADYTSLPVNFSTGISLDQAPVVRDALGVLALGLQQTTVPAVVALMRSRFLDLPDAGGALAARFLLRLYDGGSEQIDVHDLCYDACNTRLDETRGLALGHYLSGMRGDRDLRRVGTAADWCDRFTRVLDSWGWPGSGSLDSLEYQQVEAWYETLDGFRAFDAIVGNMDYETALALLRSSCERRVSQPRTDDSAVQVLGRLEAAGLAFDHLWLSGMQSSSWPAPAHPSPFIPIELQARLHMPHATPEREWLFAEGLMRQYKRGGRVVYASYCNQQEGVEELPSALLEGFAVQPPESAALLDPAWSAQRDRAAVETLQDHRAPALDPFATPGVGGSGLLEDQSQCPFRAFARRRLRVEPLPDFSVALSAAERGNLVHDALYALWTQVGDHAGLLALEEQALAVQVEEAVRHALDAVRERRRRALGAGYWSLEGERLRALLLEWLAVEKQRGEFVVVAREEKLQLELEQLQITLRVDRIDRLPDGSTVVIDYKTGACGVKDWEGDRPARPQLLLYGLAVPAAPGALAFARVRRGECAFAGLGRIEGVAGIGSGSGRSKDAQSPMAAADWEARNAQWADVLRRLAREFIAGDARVDPLSSNSCTWCGLQPLCRVDTAVTAE